MARDASGGRPGGLPGRVLRLAARLPRKARLLALGAVALGALSPAPLLLWWRAGELEQPYALWKDGKIAHIRNCTAPVTEQRLLTCATLICEQSVSRMLVNPMEAQLRSIERRLDQDSRRVQVRGSIDYRTSISIPLPTGYTCDLLGLELLGAQVTRDTAG